MKQLALFLVAGAMWAQNIGVGVRGGVPLVDAFDAASGFLRSYRNVPKHFIVGPTFEVRLPFRLGIQFDALYRKLEYEGQGERAALRTTASQWEFPLMLKYRFTGGRTAPFVAAGGSWNKITGPTQFLVGTATSGRPIELLHESSAGFVLGGGLDIKIPVLRIQPELRYTRRGSENFKDPLGDLLKSNLNQVDFLIGVTF